jgi:hypothetical protein
MALCLTGEGVDGTSRHDKKGPRRDAHARAADGDRRGRHPRYQCTSQPLPVHELSAIMARAHQPAGLHLAHSLRRHGWFLLPLFPPHIPPLLLPPPPTPIALHMRFLQGL